MKWEVKIGPCEILMISNEIRGYHWKSKSDPPSGHVLLVHGLSTYSLFQWLAHAPNGKMDVRGLYYDSSLVEKLNGQGLDVYAIDLEGHGLSMAHGKNPMYMSRGLTGAVEDIRHMLIMMKQRNNHLPIIMVGHSIGGLLVLRMSQELKQANNDVQGIILISPFMGSHHHSIKRLKPIVKIGGFLNPRYIVTNGMKNTRMNEKVSGSIKLPPRLAAKCRYPGFMIEKWASIDQEADPLVHAPYSPIYIGFISNIFEQVRLLSMYKDHAPFLILHSPHDPVSPYDPVVQFYEESTISPRSLVSLSDCLHNPLLEESTRPYLYSEIPDWISKQIDMKKK